MKISNCPVPVTYSVSGNYGNGNEILCQDIYYVDFEDVAGFQGGNSGIIQMTALPNPVETATEVQYVIENPLGFDVSQGCRLSVHVSKCLNIPSPKHRKIKH